MIVLIPSFFIIAFAQQQSVLYTGLVLFSFGKFTVFAGYWLSLILISVMCQSWF